MYLFVSAESMDQNWQLVWALDILILNTYQSFGLINRQQIGDIFLVFPENRIWNLMIIVSIGWHYMIIVSIGDNLKVPIAPAADNILGPVVRSVVSLTSSLRVISLTVLGYSLYNILIFFAEKMLVAFALQKLLTFFQQKISAYLRITRCKF